MPQRILLCTDFSENSQPAARLAAACVCAFAAELIILHVINSKRIGYPSLEGKVPIDIKNVLENIRVSVDKGLELFAEPFREGGRSVTIQSRTGVPSSVIVRFADEHAVDLIVMGTHGWTGIKHLIMGSTAENVLRSSRCPVLTVRPRPTSDRFSR